MARSITADDTVAMLERLVAERGVAPEHIRCDNGPELTAHALRDWCRFNATATAYIEPGSPWQNPYVESFNGRTRDEVLDVELFDTLAEAKVILADWRVAYNTEHPHSALGMLPPARFAASLREAASRLHTQWRQTPDSHAGWTDEGGPATAAAGTVASYRPQKAATRRALTRTGRLRHRRYELQCPCTSLGIAALAVPH